MTPGALGLEIQVRGPRASDGAVSWRKRHLPFDWENWRCPPPRPQLHTLWASWLPLGNVGVGEPLGQTLRGDV